MKKKRIEPKAGQESVWDYPRPPRVEQVSKHVTVTCAGLPLASSNRAYRVLETSHPPVFYIPAADVATEYLNRDPKRKSMCEFKGEAAYWNFEGDATHIPGVGWTYPEPRSGYEMLKDHFAFYPSKMEACYVGEERVQAQEGDFYGGWITSDIVGPFKGGPGTFGW